MSQENAGSIIIACGGTGGHLFPGIAVAQELKRKGHKVTLLISKKEVDAKASGQYGDLDFREVEAIGLPKIPSLGMFKFLVKLFKSVRTAKKVLKEVNADAVLGMGGFTSFPVVYMARKLKLKTYIHDSNALPGKANRMTARWCNRVLLGVEEASHYFDQEKCVVTGTPIREEMKEKASRSEGLEFFKLPDTGEKVVLAMGGSQGAKNLNTLIMQVARECVGFCRFILIAGSNDYLRVKEESKDMENLHVYDFCSNMRAAYAAGDVIICRAGASSLTELAHMGKASFLIPYPYAADDHQAHNARVFASKGAAVVCREQALTCDTVVEFLHSVFDDDARLQAMQQAALLIDVPDAAARISEVIESDLS